MRKVSKSILALGICATLLGGCAVYPYDRYAYDDPYYYRERPQYYDYYDYGPRYYYGPGVYVAPPAVALGFSWSRGYRRH